MIWHGKLILLLSCFLISFLAHAGQLFYVFKDDTGRTLIQDSIPDKYARLGYRIINELGITLEIVPSVKEQKRKARKLREKREKERMAEIQRQKDKNLIASFSNVDDIRETGNKKISSIQSQINVTRKHISAFEQNLDVLQNQAAKKTESNKKLSNKELLEIEKIKDSIEQNKQFIKRQVTQQEKIREQYINYIKRYKKIRGD